MKRFLLIAAIVVAAATAVLVPRAGDTLKRFEAFRAEQVRVVGAHYLAAEEAIAVSGITRASGLFDDRRPWRAALLAHPLVDDVAIERRFPGTIVIRITEVEPVALARTPELRPIDVHGRVLPIDPAGQPLDLPVLAVSLDNDDDANDEEAPPRGPGVAALLNAYERVRRLEPELAAQVSEIHPAAGGAVRLMLAGPAGIEALVPGDADAADLRRLRLALRDLSKRGELRAVRGVDVRFRDQAVVSMTPTPSS